MTGKATGVLRQKIFAALKENGLNENEDCLANLQIATISKLTKKAQVVGLKDSGDTVYVNKWQDPRSFRFDVLILDELSMVPHYIQQWWSLTPCLVIGLGDYCQIPEVHTVDTQREIAGFRHDLKLPPSRLVNGYGVKVLRDLSTFELKTVLRSTGDITLLCNELRNFDRSKDDVIETIKEWANKSPDITYSNLIADIEIGDDWQIIAYTNKMCKKINDALAIGDVFPDYNDKIILHDNLNPILAYNGEVYVFKDLLNKVKAYNSVFPSSGLYVVWKFNNQMPSKNSKSAVERASYMTWVTYRLAAKDIHRRRLDDLPNIIDSINFISDEQKKEYKEGIESYRAGNNNEETCFNYIIERFGVIDRDVTQYIMNRVPSLPQVYFVNIGFGYCCTTHKSQGSEYPKVCYILEKMDRPLLYTGASRAKEKLKVIDLTENK